MFYCLARYDWRDIEGPDTWSMVNERPEGRRSGSANERLWLRGVLSFTRARFVFLNTTSLCTHRLIASRLISRFDMRWEEIPCISYAVKQVRCRRIVTENEALSMERLVYEKFILFKNFRDPDSTHISMPCTRSLGCNVRLKERP